LANAVASYHQAIQTQPSSAVQSAIEGSAAMIDGGDYRGAIDLATFAIQRRSDAADAYLVRARANEALGDSNQALADLDTTLALNPADGYAGFLKGQIYQTEGDAQGAVDAYAQALARPMSRLWQVAAAARRGSILLDLGDPAGAVSSLQRAADIAAQVESNHEPIWFNGELVRMGSEARRPAVLLTLARAQDAAGAVSDAASVYAQIASDYPTSGESSSALSALEDDGFAGLVSDFVRGRVLLASGNPSDAIDAFASVAPDGPNAAPARYYAALAQGALGDATEEGAELRSMAREFPGHPLAATALQQAAQIVEATDSAQNAIAAYESVADAFPASDEATSSLFRAAALRLGSGDRVGAEAAWKRIADLTSSSTVRARALFARGRARLQDRDDGGATDLADAARAAPWSYDGLRAADVVKRGLGAEPLVAQRAARLSPPPPKSGDDSACASWLDSWASDAQEAAGQPAAIDRIRRLSAVGLSAAAESEALDAARDSASQPHALFALARALTDSGMFSPAIYAANRLASVSPAGSLESAPDCLRRIAYPQAFADLVQDQSMQNGLDPYVLLALLREESWFDPMARSGSPAYGLSQVTQPTGADIARGL